MLATVEDFDLPMITLGSRFSYQKNHEGYMTTYEGVTGRLPDKETDSSH